MSNEALKELLTIANEMAEEHMSEDGGFYYCTFCGREYAYENSKRTVSHHENCPILKLEQFKVNHRLALFDTRPINTR